MRVIQRTDEPADRLEQLADQAAGFASAPEPPSPEDQRAAEQQAQAMGQIEAGAQRMVLGVLKAVRTRIGRKLPEIHQEWKDPDLDAVAAAAIPVGAKHLARLMPLIGQWPEEAALAVACFPLLMGYLAAVQRHDDTLAAAAAGATAVPAAGVADGAGGE